MQINKSLENIDLHIFNNKSIDIIDWGCGQGLATICFLDYLKDKEINATSNKISLIEPSDAARKRAESFCKLYVSKECIIHPVGKLLDNVNFDDITSSSSICIHFFSNILDIPSIDLKSLTDKIDTIIEGEHYFFCIGPLNNGNIRINRFYDYFKTPETLINHSEAEYKYDAVHTCSFNIKVFKLTKAGKNLIASGRYPDVQFYAAYQLDAVRALIRNSSDEEKTKIAGLYGQLSSFEVTATFDIGAGVYEDVNPILAVLHNIIVRGLSKAKGLKFNMLLDYCIGKAAASVKEFYVLPIGEKLYHHDPYYHRHLHSSGKCSLAKDYACLHSRFGQHPPLALQNLLTR